MMGGVGPEGVRAFYRDHLVGKFFPPDVTMTAVSRTVDENESHDHGEKSVWLIGECDYPQDQDEVLQESAAAIFGEEVSAWHPGSEQYPDFNTVALFQSSCETDTLRPPLHTGPIRRKRTLRVGTVEQADAQEYFRAWGIDSTGYPTPVDLLDQLTKASPPHIDRGLAKCGNDLLEGRGGSPADRSFFRLKSRPPRFLHW